MARGNTTVRNQHRKLIARGRPPCHLCGDPIDYDAHYLDPLSFTIDHVVPIARGGADDIDNLAPAHRGCNRSKGDSHPDEGRVIYATQRNWVDG